MIQIQTAYEERAIGIILRGSLLEVYAFQPTTGDSQRRFPLKRETLVYREINLEDESVSLTRTFPYDNTIGESVDFMRNIGEITSRHGDGIHCDASRYDNSRAERAPDSREERAVGSGISEVVSGIIKMLPSPRRVDVT